MLKLLHRNGGGVTRREPSAIALDTDPLIRPAARATTRATSRDVTQSTAGTARKDLVYFTDLLLCNYSLSELSLLRNSSAPRIEAARLLRPYIADIGSLYAF